MRQQKQNKSNQKDKQNKEKKNNKKDSEKKQNQNQNQQDRQEKHQSTEKMSKDNAEQLLNYAVQAEKATQQRLNKNKRQSQTRRLKENW